MIEDDDPDADEENKDQPKEREDDYALFKNDKDLRHPETISIKAQNFKGICVNVKILNHIWIDNLLFAIENC